MEKNYKTIDKLGEEEVIIKKSRFIGYAAPVEEENEALEFIKKIREKHNDATHNVFAYLIGNSNNIQRYSDDKEPSGTAGIPILEYLKKEELKNIVVVVTRYFGGIKLGVGGLVRAYLKGAKAGVESGEIVEKQLFNKLKIKIDYKLQGKIENELSKYNFTIESISYEEKVSITILSKVEDLENLLNIIGMITNMSHDYEVYEPEFVSVKI